MTSCSVAVSKSGSGAGVGVGCGGVGSGVGLDTGGAGEGAGCEGGVPRDSLNLSDAAKGEPWLVAGFSRAAAAVICVAERSIDIETATRIRIPPLSQADGQTVTCVKWGYVLHPIFMKT